VRRLAALACLLLTLLTAPAHAAAPASVVVEIDGAAERLVDARSARRLVPLELSDVSVPPGSGLRSPPVLFFRVLGRSDGSLRIELWERGEYHGARALSGAGANPQLVARRVALAAAELGRRLARKREATLARDAKLRRAREARERDERQRTQDGPLALRPELAVAAVPSQLWLVGQRLTSELTLRGPLRLDVGGELWAGWLEPSLHAELEAVTLAPAYRLSLTRWLDLDLSAQLAALLVQLPTAQALDGISNQNSSWTARATGAGRLELRLSRQVRATFGLDAGALLRDVSYGFRDRHAELAGAWWSAGVGVVITPPR
jgi:hypothetical protein